MTNSRTRRTTRKIDPYVVYDQLPAPIRAVLQEGPQEWDAVWARNALRSYAKCHSLPEAISRVVAQVNRAHAMEIDQARPWQVSRLRAKRIPSPHMLAQATMQTSGRI